MSAKKKEIIPRVYDREQSAAYVGVAPNTFDKLVAAGVFPESLPYREAGVDRNGWDLKALDHALDLMSGLVANDNIDVAREKARQVLNGRKTALRH